MRECPSLLTDGGLRIEMRAQRLAVRGPFRCPVSAVAWRMTSRKAICLAGDLSWRFQSLDVRLHGAACCMAVEAGKQGCQAEIVS